MRLKCRKKGERSCKMMTAKRKEESKQKLSSGNHYWATRLFGSPLLEPVPLLPESLGLRLDLELEVELEYFFSSAGSTRDLLSLPLLLSYSFFRADSSSSLLVASSPACVCLLLSLSLCLLLNLSIPHLLLDFPSHLLLRLTLYLCSSRFLSVAAVLFASPAAFFLALSSATPLFSSSSLAFLAAPSFFLLHPFRRFPCTFL